jgi:imidazole glycerol-phosphate synthase subunit HisF
LLKRLIGVITVHNGWAVQSIGFERYLPLGRPEVIAENYDQWQLDEILIMDIDRTRNKIGPNFEVLKRISSKKIMTPISYVGGVRCVDDALSLVRIGADRIGIDTLFHTDYAEAVAVREAIGQQAIIRVQPVVENGGEIYRFDYLNKCMGSAINGDSLKEESEVFSEYMIIDAKNEGGVQAFSESILKPFMNQNLQLICFGGITCKEQVVRLLGLDVVSAVAVGNSLSYTEIANKELLVGSDVNVARSTSFGLQTRGAREW